MTKCDQARYIDIYIIYNVTPLVWGSAMYHVLLLNEKILDSLWAGDVSFFIGLSVNILRPYLSIDI
jgi:hypothetical protein